MRDAFERVFERMGEIVHRIDDPLVARVRMLGVTDAVNDGVAHIDVGRRHINLGAQHLFPVRELARSHSAEKVEVFLDAAVSVRALLARLRERTARGAYLLRREVTHIRLARLDEGHGAVVHTLEIIGRVENSVPLEPQPADVLFYALHILDVLFDGVGVVETEIAFAAEFFLYAEIDADGLRVAYVKITVGFGRKARDNLVVLSRAQVVADDVFDEIRGFGNASVFVHTIFPPIFIVEYILPHMRAFDKCAGEDWK